MVNATYFTYAGQSSATYGLQIAALTGLTPDSVEENEAFSPTLVTQKVPRSLRFYHGGIQYDTVPTCQFSVLSESAISPANRRAILGWLVGRNEFKALTFDSTDFTGLTYYCVFTVASTIYINGVCHGFNLTATFDSQFARGASSSFYYPEQIAPQDTVTLLVNNASDIKDAYVYPTIHFFGSNVWVSVINVTDDDNRSFTFKGEGSNQSYSIDCETKTIRANGGQSVNISSLVSKKWLRLRQGVNSLQIKNLGNSSIGNFSVECPQYVMIGY